MTFLSRQQMFVIVLLLSACIQHQTIDIKVDHYPIKTPIHQQAITVWIEPNTLNQEILIKQTEFGGIQNSWIVQAGQLLKQHAQIELSQFFTAYYFTTEFPSSPEKSDILRLKILNFRYDNYQSKITLKAMLFSPQQKIIWKNNYQATGTKIKKYVIQVPKAIKLSSQSAFQQIFAELRQDLHHYYHRYSK